MKRKQVALRVVGVLIAVVVAVAGFIAFFPVVLIAPSFRSSFERHCQASAEECECALDKFVMRARVYDFASSGRFRALGIEVGDECRRWPPPPPAARTAR